MLSKSVIAGLAGLAVLGINKGLLWCGLPHLAPSIVTAIVIAIGGLSTWLAEVAPQKESKHWHALVSLLALAGAIGAQYAPLPGAVPPAAPIAAVEVSAPVAHPDAEAPAVLVPPEVLEVAE